MLGSAPNRCRPQHLQKSQNKKEGLTKVKPSFFLMLSRYIIPPNFRL